MKFLLTAINSKYIHSNLAVYSLKASAGEIKDLVAIREFTINNQKEAILGSLFSERPGVLFFSVYIWNLEYVTYLAREFHKLCPTVPIWAGGPEVSFETEKFLRENPAFCGVLVGEGERTFYEVCRYYNNGGVLRDIRGILYRACDEYVYTGARECADMNTLSFAYDDMEEFENRIVYYESSRGCPFNCSYCLSSVDKALRFKDTEIVKKELGFFISKKVPQVKFVDRTFNCDHRHAMEIWKFIKANDNAVTNFHFEISADLLTDEELDIMKDMRPGLIQLEIGVQSVNGRTIKEIHRTMKLERLEEVVKRIKSFGNIHEHLDLIAGLPYEDMDSFKKSFNRVYGLYPEQLQLGFLKVLKGSFMYEHVKDYGIVYEDTPPYEVRSTKWIDYRDILKLKTVEEMVEVYYNSHQYEMGVKVLEGFFEDAFSFYEALGKFYEKKGYMDVSHTRIRRCEILLEFFDEMGFDVSKRDKLREALVFDIYSRENSKTRPKFCDDEREWRELSFAACDKGKLKHLERFRYDFLKDLEEVSEAVYVLFDYEKRDALTGKAQAGYYSEGEK